MKRLNVRRWSLVAGLIVPLCLGQGCPMPSDGLPSGTGDPGADGAQGPQGPQGEPGPQGPPGADGQLRIYGDGSAGAATVTVNGDLLTLFPEGNYQFTDFTIEAGVTLTVTSNTVIRCTGTFTNNGAIVVETGSSGGDPTRPALPGISTAPPGNGVSGPNNLVGSGGAGGVGLTEARARNVLGVDWPVVGGGGAGTGAGPGGNGGGSLLILAQAGIVNAGLIRANGSGSNFIGGGGGGGGIILLASPTSIINTGTVTARGGNGGGGIGAFSTAAGGGGGGGIVHLLSPDISDTGTVDVTGGSGGTGDTQPNLGDHSGGGGGGASGGNGGTGGSFGNLSGANSGADGQPGYYLQTIADPTALF